MKYTCRDAATEVKFSADTGCFEGYAALFAHSEAGADSVNDMILPGAFAASLQVLEREKRVPPMLWQHDAKEPIGVWRVIREDRHGLFVKGELFIEDIPRAREAYRLLKEKVVTGLSIGYRAIASKRDEKTGLRQLASIELIEISLVTFPANSGARVSRVKSSGDDLTAIRELTSLIRNLT